MTCECGGKLVVTDSVHVTNDEIYRRRKCKKCSRVIFTSEFEVEHDECFKELWNKNYRKRRLK